MESESYKNDYTDHIQTALRDIPFYSKYYQKIKDITHASDTLIYSGMQFILSLGLQNASITTEMGEVKPNIGVVGIFPSGYSKSPMLRVIRESLRFWPLGRNNHIQSFEMFSPEGIKSFLNKLSDEEKTHLYKMTLLRDEVSTLAKSTRNGMMSVSGLEFLSNLLDGTVEQHDTRTSGHETFPESIYCPMWFTGTPAFWANITNDWWTQGVAFRMLYPLKSKMDTRGIGWDYSNLNLDTDFRQYIDSLTLISEFIPDDDFKTLYKEETQKVKEIQHQSTIDGKSEEMDKQYYKKFPEIVLKLSMLHRAAMMIQPKKISIPSETNERCVLFLTKEDFEWARQEFEMYHEGFIQAYNSYLDAQSERYRRVDTSALENKFMKYYAIVKDEKKLTYTTNEDNSITKDDKGEWLKLSDICRFANFNGFDKDAVIKSLLTKGLIERCMCLNHYNEVVMVKLAQ